MKKILLLTLLIFLIPLVYAENITNQTVNLIGNITNQTVNSIENSTNITAQTIPGITDAARTSFQNIKESIVNNPIKYIIGLVVFILVIYFIYLLLEKDSEKDIEKYYKKAEEMHKTAEEYHQDGFPALAEKTHKKAEKFRQKAREIKATL